MVINALRNAQFDLHSKTTLMHVDSPKTLGQIFRKGILILTQDIYCEDVRAQSNVRSIYTQHTAE